MCGIAGIINFNKSSGNLVADIRQMSDIIRHRGPDDAGFLFVSKSNVQSGGSSDTAPEVWNSLYPQTPTVHLDAIPDDNYFLAFAHRRLSIIDMSAAGHQPMCDSEKKIWIAFNGEIYNYIELRTVLQQKGYTFHTATDTEVIIAAYAEWGISCVNHFNGMWSFALYDARKNCVFFSRDRIGVKPFYYYSDSRCFAFASEQKALVQMAFVSTGINPVAVFDYFARRTIETEPEGMFKNIIELPPSHSALLDLESGKLHIERYYTLQVNKSFETFDSTAFETCKSELYQVFHNAVQLRLRSDVPVAGALSGGIDSSSIVCAMRNLLPPGATIKTFTAGFNDTRYDESHWAQCVVDKTQSAHHITFPTLAELEADLEQLIYSQDIPVWSTSTYAQFRVMRLAKEHGVKVMLNGQGSDELFGGYPNHHIARWMELLARGRWKSTFNAVKNYLPFPQNLSFFVRQYLKFYGLKKLPDALQIALKKRYYPEIEFLSPDLWHTYKHRLAADDGYSMDSLNSMLQFELQYQLLKGFLKCEDRCSMWHSIESRTPFADDLPLIEFAFRLPSAYKIHDNRSKYILREAMRSLLPQAVADRRDKMGYVTPNNDWVYAMRESMVDFFDASLSPFIDVKKLKSRYSTFFDMRNQPEDGSRFKFFLFAYWKQIFRL